MVYNLCSNRCMTSILFPQVYLSTVGNRWNMCVYFYDKQTMNSVMSAKRPPGIAACNLPDDYVQCLRESVDTVQGTVCIQLKIVSKTNVGLFLKKKLPSNVSHRVAVWNAEYQTSLWHLHSSIMGSGG